MGENLYSATASKLHKAVGECLRLSTHFKGYTALQEVNVKDILPSYYTNKHHFDWVIPELYLVIECHGQQHYTMQSFGDKTEKHVFEYHEQRRRDKEKKEAALAAGYTYLEIPFTDINKISEEYLLDLYLFYKNHNPISKEAATTAYKTEQKKKQKIKRQEYLESDEHKKKLELASQRRKSYYNLQKKRRLEYDRHIENPSSESDETPKD